MKLLIIIFSTFTLGTYLSLNDISSACYFALFYFLSLYILYRSITSDFYVSSEKNRFDLPESKVILHGEQLPGESRVELQEERFLNHFHMNTVVKRQFFTYMFLGLAVYLLFLTGKVPLNLSTVIPLICGFFFIKSVFIGHLYVPLALNIYSVINQRSGDEQISLTILYAVAVFITLKMMSELTGAYLKWKKTFVLLPALVIFLGTVYGLSFFFEHKPDLQKISRELVPARNALSKIKVHQNRLLSQLSSLPETSSSIEIKQKINDQLQKIADIEKSLDSGSFFKSPSRTKQMISDVMNENLEINNQAQELKSSLMEGKSGNFSPTLRELAERHQSNSAERIEKIRKEMDQIQENIYQLQNDQSSSQPENIKDLEQKRSDLKSEFEKLSNLSDSEKEELKKFVQQNMKDLEMMKGLGADKGEIKEQSTKFEELNTLTNKQHQSPEDFQKISKILNESTKPDLQGSETSSEQEINFHDVLKPFEKKPFQWKKLLPLLVLALVFMVASYLLKKKGIQEVEVLEPEVLKEIKEEWQKLKKLNLSPRDEVIHYYNILHDLFQKIHYTEHETPPSCIVFEHMKDFNPKLDRATFFVTEIYTQVFYGKKEITPPALKTYRKSVSVIMQFYGI